MLVNPMFFAFIIFLFGLGCGSFINVLIHRLPRGQPIGFGPSLLFSRRLSAGEAGQGRAGRRSFCPRCGKTLCWWELIPVVSLILLRGRCSKCKAKISWQYPIVELATGVSFVLIFRKFIINYGLLVTGYSLLNLIFWFFIAALLIAIFAIDLKHYIIPNKLVYTGIGVWLVWLGVNNFLATTEAQNIIGNAEIISAPLLPSVLLRLQGFYSFPWSNLLTTHILFSIISAGFFWLLVLITKGKGMGMGDVKLAGLLGLVFGARVVDVFFLAFIIGGFVGCILIFAQKKTLKSKVPFGPFLCGAALLLMFL